MLERLSELQTEALDRIQEAATPEALEEVRVRFLGRKGSVTEILRGIGQATGDARKQLGKASNEVKQVISSAIEERRTLLDAQTSPAGERPPDLTLPGRRPDVGRMHPMSRLTNEIVDIFGELGFQVATGPDIETEYYNFDALNTPPDHPARDLHDTFFVRPGVVLRTHTSPVQMRVMESSSPPVAVVVPGRVFRVDADATHSPMFCQVEGLLVDEGVTFADLKGTLMYFVHRLFGKSVKMRFRPHFFPFTEPSAEVDIYWSAGDRSGWLEILGCGMVHPEVFRHAGYDSERYTGFAFGLGVDRAAMVLHGIDSIHHLYQNDMRFLEQF
jgi:phenylalanyl-tRNA synthetase alpha chain